MATLLNVCYEKAAVPVLILSQEASKQLALSVVTGMIPHKWVLLAAKTYAVVRE